MPKLIGGVRSRSFRVRWALEELGVAHEHLPALPRTPEVTTLNPSGKVPVYVEDDGTIITDSMAILTYLADKHGCLTYPAGTIERARQDSLTFAILDEVDAVLWTASKHSFVLPEDKRMKAVKETLKWEWSVNLERLAERIQTPFVMGEVMTVADILLAHCTGWGIVAKFPEAPPKVRAHLKAMQARDAYQRAREG